MVLVHLTVDGSSCLLVTLLNDVLVYDSGSNLLVNSGIMVTSLVPEADDVIKSSAVNLQWKWQRGEQTPARLPFRRAQAERHTGNK